MQVERHGVLGRIARAVARQPHDRHDRELTLDLRQPAFVRNQEGRRPIDRLRQQLGVDRFAVRIERAGSEALGGRELVLLSQRADALPDRNATVGQQRLGQGEATIAGRVARVREQLTRFAHRDIGLRAG